MHFQTQNTLPAELPSQFDQNVKVTARWNFKFQIRESETMDCRLTDADW